MTDDNHAGWHRRRFIAGAGMIALTMQAVSSCTNADGSRVETGDVAEGLLIHSTPGFFGHRHDLLIPHALLNAPPVESVSLQSTSGLSHTHTIQLSQRQLIEVRDGGQVSVAASSHTFLISLRPPSG